jgi:tetratricopeptide (TPR) repeat protein
MKITEDNKYDLIDNYISGNMDMESSELFESLLHENEELSIEVNLIRELNDFQEFSTQESELKASLNDIRKESKPNGSVLKFLLLFLVAAGLLFMFFKTLKQDADKSAYSAMAMVEPLEIVTKDGSSFKDLRVMQDLYNTEQYKSAYPYILSYLQSNPGDLDVILAKGISLMEMQKFSDAHNVFLQIESMDPRVKKYKWYTAINYIKQGQNEKAITILKEIQSQQSYNYDKVSDVLEDLK